MTALERNLTELSAAGWWVAVGRVNGFYLAAALREGGIPATRAADTIPECIAGLARDLEPGRQAALELEPRMAEEAK